MNGLLYSSPSTGEISRTCISILLYELAFSSVHCRKFIHVLLSMFLSINFWLIGFLFFFNLIDIFFSFVALMWSRGHVVLVNIWAEVLLLELGGALIAALMGIGPVIAKLEIGKTSVIDAEKEVI